MSVTKTFIVVTAGALIAGISQQLSLHLNPGTYMFSESCSLSVSVSEGLQVQGDMLQDGRLTLSHTSPSTSVDVVLQLLAAITPTSPNTFDAKV